MSKFKPLGNATKLGVLGTRPLAAVTALNFFFVPPRWTFEVENPEHFIGLGAMLVVALVISHLAKVVRRETELARLNERRARQLQVLATNLSNEVTRAIGAETTLTANLSQEIADRKQGDADTLAVVVTRETGCSTNESV